MNASLSKPSYEQKCDIIGYEGRGQDKCGDVGEWHLNEYLVGLFSVFHTIHVTLVLLVTWNRMQIHVTHADVLQSYQGLVDIPQPMLGVEYQRQTHTYSVARTVH